jgi:hypothetical protein
LTSNDQCEDCSSVKYSDETGLISDGRCAGLCSAGKYSDETGLDKDDQCTVCVNEQYSNSTGQQSCKKCEVGQAVFSTGVQNAKRQRFPV